MDLIPSTEQKVEQFIGKSDIFQYYKAKRRTDNCQGWQAV
jgi:hypothetical protein